MKKPHVKRIVLLIAAVFVFLAAVIIGKRLITPITYSNLATSESLDYVVNVLGASEVTAEQIGIFKDQVEFTNAYLKGLPGLQGDFTLKRGTVASYHDNLAFNMFVSVKLPEDLNCRVAAWNLIKHNIDATPLEGEIEYSEQNILDYYPYTGFIEGDKEKFWSVFKGIGAGGFNTKNGYANIIQEEWKNRGVQFEDNSVSLISCFAYASDNKWLEAVHTGVMINVEGGVVFIEKYNPKAPFQVSKFSSEKDLRYYLEQRLLGAFILQPVIMKNDTLL